MWRLLHIKEAAELALDLARGESRETFFEKSELESAVNYQFIIVGEAAAAIVKKYPEFVEEHSEIPWTDMRNMRNIYVHEYHRDFSDESWYMVSERLPKIYASIIELIKNLAKE
ncbi:MAG: DUF86 domain-containing protein [Alphaproteobacteria bacterium]|nr:DUF86 domain-containing protein [Alphaproteobacteria bacterium]